MKKHLMTILAVAAIASSALACVACGSGDSNSGGNNNSSYTQTQPDQSQNVTPQLTYGKKYILDDDVKIAAGEQTWCIFNADGTGKYHIYYKYESSYYGTEISDYTINFKYSYTNTLKTKIACFYDSITYGATDNQKSDRRSWSTVFEMGENMILDLGQYGYSIYVNEDYIKQIPNFGEESND